MATSGGPELSEPRVSATVSSTHPGCGKYVRWKRCTAILPRQLSWTDCATFCEENGQRKAKIIPPMHSPNKITMARGSTQRLALVVLGVAWTGSCVATVILP